MEGEGEQTVPCEATLVEARHRSPASRGSSGRPVEVTGGTARALIPLVGWVLFVGGPFSCTPLLDGVRELDPAVEGPTLPGCGHQYAAGGCGLDRE